MLPEKDQNPNGLFAKYYIQKIDGWVDVVPKVGEPYRRAKLKPIDEGSEYFALRVDNTQPDKDELKACRIAINAYAQAIEAKAPQLAKDIRANYPLL